MLRPSSLAGLVVIVALAACSPPRVGPVREITSQAATLIASAPKVIGPSASQIPKTQADEQVRATFEGALPAAAKRTLKHEPALDLVARVAADMASGEKQPPSAAITEWLFWRAGATSRFARLDVMIAEGGDDLDFQLADHAGRAQASVYPEAYGVARSTRGRPAQVIVYGRRLVELDPMPKSYEPGAPIKITARPLDAFTDVMLMSDDPSGSVVAQRLAPTAGGAYTITTKAPTQPGRYFLELTGLDPRSLASTPENPWRRTLFLAPVYVGVPEACAPDAFMIAPGPQVSDATSWAGKIVDGYNEARRGAGKPPIASDGRLITLAQERMKIVARAGREPAPDVVLADKLAASGYPPHDYDAAEAELDSPKDYVGLRLLIPSVRRRVLGAEPFLVAVAIAPKAAGSRGALSQVAVEYAVEPVARVDVAKDRAKVLAALDAHAKGEGRPPYKHDEDVAKAVQRFADEVCRGQVRANQMKLLVDKARGVGDKYRQWSTPVWRAGYDYTRWQEASVLAKSREAPLTHAEAGLCQGHMPGKPGGSYVVVIQYAP
jgi:hypothetical protein